MIPATIKCQIPALIKLLIPRLDKRIMVIFAGERHWRSRMVVNCWISRKRRDVPSIAEVPSGVAFSREIPVCNDKVDINSIRNSVGNISNEFY